MFCKNCGKFVAVDDNFCRNCGARIEKEADSAIREKTAEGVFGTSGTEMKMPSFITGNEGGFDRSSLRNDNWGNNSENSYAAEKTATDNSGFEKDNKEKESLYKSSPEEGFNWNLEGFPVNDRKTEEIDFNWESVLEANQERIYPVKEKEAVKVEDESREEPAFHSIDPMKSDYSRDDSERVNLYEALEKDIQNDFNKSVSNNRGMVFGGSNAEKVDDFYNGSRIKSDLQEILDKECDEASGVAETPALEKVETAPVTESAEAAEMFTATDGEQEESVTCIEDILNEHVDIAPALKSLREMNEKLKRGDSFSEIFPEEVTYVATVLSQPAKGYVVEAAEQPTENEQVSPSRRSKNKHKHIEHSKTEDTKESELKDRDAKETEEFADSGKDKLTFGDIFNDDDDSEEETLKKKGGALKVVAAILFVIVLLELVTIGIQYFAPESSAGKFITEGYEKVMGIFNDDKDKAAEDAKVDEQSEISKAIENQSSKNKNIPVIEEDKTLFFESGKNYGYEKLSKAYEFDNEPWYTNSKGKTVSYYDEIMATVIQYYSCWVDKINKNDNSILNCIDKTSDFYAETRQLTPEPNVVYGIDRLGIGQIRSNGSGFYVMVSVTKADSTAVDKIAETQIVYLEPDNKKMEIVTIKKC